MADPSLATPGSRLRAARKQAGISQADLAKQFGSGESRLSRIEGDKSPIGKLAGPAASLLGVTTDFLLLGREDTDEGAEKQASKMTRQEIDMAILRLMIDREPPERRKRLIWFLERQVMIFQDILRDMGEM
jgi:transcriptional regulator with XRE-family HTH domain